MDEDLRRFLEASPEDTANQRGQEASAASSFANPYSSLDPYGGISLRASSNPKPVHDVKILVHPFLLVWLQKPVEHRKKKKRSLCLQLLLRGENW